MIDNVSILLFLKRIGRKVQWCSVGEKPNSKQKLVQQDDKEVDISGQKQGLGVVSD